MSQFEGADWGYDKKKQMVAETNYGFSCKAKVPCSKPTFSSSLLIDIEVFSK